MQPKEVEEGGEGGAGGGGGEGKEGEKEKKMECVHVRENRETEKYIHNAKDRKYEYIERTSINRLKIARRIPMNKTDDFLIH